MAPRYRLPKIVRSAEARHAFPFVVVTLLFVSTALAAPVTYTGLTITDGQLGSWSFTNARVYLTFQTDTSFVQQTQIAGVNVADVWPIPRRSFARAPRRSLARRGLPSSVVEEALRPSHRIKFSSAFIRTTAAWNSAPAARTASDPRIRLALPAAPSSSLCSRLHFSQPGNGRAPD